MNLLKNVETTTEFVENDIHHYLDLNSGFQTNELLELGSKTELDEYETMPELYKEISVESDGYRWYPTFITIPKRGMLFADGKNKNDWTWCVTNFIKNDGNYIPDMKNASHLDKEYFTAALYLFNIITQE